MKINESSVVVVLVAKTCLTLLDPLDCSLVRLCPWNFPGKNAEVGCHFLLQGIVPSQGSNTSLLHWQVDPLPLSHLGSKQRHGDGENHRTCSLMMEQQK